LKAKFSERRERLEKLLKGDAFAIDRSFAPPTWKMSGVWIEQEQMAEQFFGSTMQQLSLAGFPRLSSYDPVEFLGKDRIAGVAVDEELELYWKSRPSRRAIALYNLAVGQQ